MVTQLVSYFRNGHCIQKNERYGHWLLSGWSSLRSLQPFSYVWCWRGIRLSTLTGLPWDNAPAQGFFLQNQQRSGTYAFTHPLLKFRIVPEGRERNARWTHRCGVGTGDRRLAISSPRRRRAHVSRRRAMWPVRRSDGDPPPTYGKNPNLFLSFLLWM
jgi:hypothetical protein